MRNEIESLNHPKWNVSPCHPDQLPMILMMRKNTMQKWSWWSEVWKFRKFKFYHGKIFRKNIKSRDGPQRRQKHKETQKEKTQKGTVLKYLFFIFFIKSFSVKEKKKKRKRKSSDSDEPQWVETKLSSKPSTAPVGIGPQMVKTEPIGPEMPQYVFKHFIFYRLASLCGV